uniref:NADH dehydrogenase subunit 6 n=1 Tax=Capitonius sp. QL-2013 TaxID=1421593 RepID=A0A0A6ZKY4_9HYME|nr:NADH dehydrogenase subunit 6 [Capitonius sp. QL-2013]
MIINLLLEYKYIFIMILDIVMFVIMLIPSNFLKFHPFMLSLILGFYTIVLVLKLNILNNNYWYSYLLFLLMIGGVMILILYLTSISNNELFKMNFKFIIYFFFKVFLMIISMIYMINIMGLFNFNINFISLEISQMIIFFDEYFMKNLYMVMDLNLSIYLIIYLLILLILSVLICLKNFLPLRQLND